jgi:prepilin-type N-terminal cleavage/methylation domain-containing protein
MKQRGFTLIEVMIGIVGVMILLSFVAGFAGFANGNSTVSYGINGMTEIRCIDGYKFVISQNGGTRQVLDEFGKGSRCENSNISKPGSFGQ